MVTFGMELVNVFVGDVMVWPSRVIDAFVGPEVGVDGNWIWPVPLPIKVSEIENPFAVPVCVDDKASMN
jgi:hypothetical protein